ncbi:MAG: type I pullulanase [Lachnospiraceae bacterium]|nr:type I pullulanase [Lachnospiraceae bacterium]
MRKSSIKMKALSVMLATSLVTTSIQVFPVKAEKGEGVVRATRSFDSNYDAQNAYSGDDLGCTYTKEKTTFKVWTPEATKVVLCRYEKGNGGSIIEEVDMVKGDKGVWSATITGDIVNTYYTYKVTVNGKTNEAVDIYAKAAGVNGKRAMVVDLDSTDPDNWDKDYKREKTQLSDISVWEIHIRDFSIDVSSGVSEKNRGKYKAFTEKTTVNGEGRVASCVDYLKELGVTHVQLLPMYDYGSEEVDETKVTNTLGSNYNWGYDPLNYNVPEGSYSSNPYDGNVRITEMKEMIQALHDAGIKVVMDVVYNHTYDTADSNFNKIAPDYYYKLNSDLTYNNQSGCGNATRSQSAMYRKFMIDSVSYWAGEYNLDGFRFDLMAIHDVTTMNQIRSTLDKKYGKGTIVLYGEGWAATDAESDGAWKGNEGQLDPGIGFFNDQIRDGIKGEHKFGDGTGFVQTNYTTSDYGKLGEKWPNNVFGGIMGSVGNFGGPYWMWRPFWSKSSNCTISYTSAHDNLTLWDKLTENFGKQWDSTDERLLRMNKMAGSIVLVSKGGTFMQAGEEFARTKHGDDNSYRSPDSINKIDWTRLNTYENVWKYYEGMLEIRQVFSGFRSILTRKDGDNWNPQNNNINWIKRDEYGVSAFTETNNVSGEWNQIGVIINNATSEATMNLGSGKWVVIADGNTAGLTKIAEYDGSSVKAAGKSVVVAVPKNTFDANPNVADLLRKNQTRNTAPVISGVEDQTVSVGSKVEFMVSATDADGDTVTLAAKDLPTGAEFDAKTGKFSWDNAAEGEYTITITANDGTDTTTKTMKLTVTSPASALRTLIAEVEAAGLSGNNLCAATLDALNTALAAAKTVAEKDTPSEAECSEAVRNLNTAYETACIEKGAYDDLKGTIKSVEDKIGAATGDDYDAAAIADAKEVVADAKTLLESKGTKTAYSYAMENLQDAADAIVSNLSTPQVHVSTSLTSPYIYIWTGTGATATKVAGEWPGTALKNKDANGNYVYELPNDGTYNIIINNGATSKQQTKDLEGLSGDITIKVADTSSSQDASGNSIYEATTDCKPVSSGTREVNKESLREVIQNAKGLNEADYDAERFEAMKSVLAQAEEVATKTNATQVEVNQQARKLRSAMLALGAEIEVIIPTETPVVTVSPTGTPDITTEEPSNTPEVTKTPDVEETIVPTGSEIPAVTPTPNQTTEPDQTTEPNQTIEPNQTTTPSETTTPNETKNPGETTTPPDVTAIPNVTNTPDANTGIKNTNAPKPTATVKPQQSPDASAVPSTVAVNKITFNPGLTQVAKKAVKITMSAKGGSGSYLYNLEISDSQGNVVASTNESKKNTYSWTPKASGTYTVYVDIKDTNTGITSKGKTCKYVVVKKKLTITQVKISKKKIVQKKSVAFTVTATGGKTKYQYAFTVKNAKGKVVKKVKYQSKKKLNWKPTKAGTYTVYVSVKDATKTVKTKKKTIKVVKK